MVAHAGQSFALGGGNGSDEQTLKEWALASHLHRFQCGKVSHSPHAGFCFRSHTRSSPGEDSESRVTSGGCVKMELLLALLL